MPYFLSYCKNHEKYSITELCVKRYARKTNQHHFMSRFNIIKKIEKFCALVLEERPQKICHIQTNRHTETD